MPTHFNIYIYILLEFMIQKHAKPITKEIDQNFIKIYVLLESDLFNISYIIIHEKKQLGLELIISH